MENRITTSHQRRPTGRRRPGRLVPVVLVALALFALSLFVFSSSRVEENSDHVRCFEDQLEAKNVAKVEIGPHSRSAVQRSSPRCAAAAGKSGNLPAQARKTISRSDGAALSSDNAQRRQGKRYLRNLLKDSGAVVTYVQGTDPTHHVLRS